MYELKHVVDYIFKDKQNYKNLSDEDKEKFFFIVNRKFARKYPKHAQFFNQKGFDKASALDIWYNFFIKERTLNVPEWYWFKQISSKKEKSFLSKEESEYLLKIYNISENDLYYIEKNYTDELKDEVKKFKKFNKNE